MTEENVEDVNTQEGVNPEAISENQNDQKPQEDKELNFAKLREKTDAAERRSSQLEEKLHSMEQSLKGLSAKSKSEEEEDISGLADDDIITVKQSRRLLKKEAEEMIQSAFSERERHEMPRKVQSKYADFKTIMTNENINKLEQEEPELAEACKKASNPWEATYKLVKKYIAPERSKEIEKGEKKLNENESRPGSLNSIKNSKPLSNANAWSGASKDELLNEMLGYSSGVL